jgi:TRAP-type transport system periplasmic protein
MIEGVQLGTIGMVTIPPGFFTGIDQRYSVLAAPGVFDGIAHGHRVVHDPEFKKVFWTIGDAKGLKMISMSCDTPSDYVTVKPIRTIADFRGRKLRVFGSKFEIETLRRLGATGVPMPLSEVIPAIQQKVIDGNKAGITVFVPFRYQTVAKYALKSTESIICINRMVSQKWFDKLPAGIQKIVSEEAGSADRRIIKFNVAVIQKMYGLWTKNGGTLTEFSPAEEKQLNRMLATVGETVLKNQPEVLAVYNVMKKVADRTRGK